MRATFLAVILIDILLAQQPPNAALANASEVDKKFASVEGKLIDAATGEAVRKANLVLMQMPGAGGGGIGSGPPPSTAAISDGEGKFSFTNVEPGRYMLSAEKSGYVRQQYGMRAGQFGPGTNLALEPGQKIANIEFRLMPQTVITGKVIDEDGEPVAHTMVSVLRRTPLAQHLTGMMGMSTNDVGEFRIAGLAPGRYVIRAEQRGPMFGGASPTVTESSPEGTLGYLPTYYPGVTEEASAGEITVAAGQHLSGVEIRLRKGRVFRVSGKIQGAFSSNSRLQVNVQPKRTGRGGGMMFGFGGGGNVKPDGTFTLPSVIPGSWDVVAMSLESGRPRMLGRASVTVKNANVENVVILAGPPLELAGHIIREADTQPATATKTGPTEA